MPERPIILFPEPESADRARKNPAFPHMQTPSFGRQYNRLQPTFTVLKTAFEQKNVKLQNSPVGMNPDFALVFEVVGTVDSFYTAVKHCEGLEWMFDSTIDDIAPDDDFFDLEKGQRSDKNLSGKVYCIMSNQQAIEQLLSLWARHQRGETEVFKRGFSGLRDVFVNIRDIRKWSAEDRISETFAVEYWRENLTVDGDNPIPFEIELFYRSDAAKRNVATRTIAYEIAQLGGRIIQECVIDGIAYHALLTELPRNAIEQLVLHYNDVALSQVDDIMFFRPTCQSAFMSSLNTEEFDSQNEILPPNNATPVVAIFDGMPIQNHPLLRNKVIIDDPDDYATGYESKCRIHGTAMTSLVLYGDLNRNDREASRPVYVRPVLKPKEVSPDTYVECVANDSLFVDVIHRAVRRIMDGEAGTAPVAPTVSVINLSIGDPVRQLAASMSPLARLIDYLSFQYKLLFIISAGNHAEIIQSIPNDFAQIKAATLTERSKLFFDAVKVNQRNMRVLSPAESLNSLTVGAVYDDFCQVGETDRFLYAVKKGLPSPVSAFGKGYRSIITPDLYYYGGRKYIATDIRNNLKWVLSNREPGCKVAAPYGDGSSAGQAFSFGTSDAAAQLTHEAAKCYDVLEQIFVNETGAQIPDEYKAILLKAMLTHGASWDSVSESLSTAASCSEKQLSKWIGNGIPNISRVESCTQNRITLIGMGTLKRDEGHIFKLPLPIDFSTKLIKRRLTSTLAYFSPVEANRQLYRGIQLWFNLEDEKNLVPDRQNTEWQSVRKGTLQHEIFSGESPVVWNDNDLIIKVNCKEDAGKYREPIPYCLFVTFEVAEGLDIDVYSKVTTRIRQRIPIRNV
jgi:hypothetical protein